MTHHLRAAGPWRYLAVASLTGVFALAVYAALTPRKARVLELVVEIQPTPDGTFLIEGSDVEQRLDAGPQGVLVGQPISAIAFDELERFLLRDPFVSGADVYTGFDGKLHVDVEQNAPLLRVHHRTGADYYVGPRGEVLPLSKRDVARVPVLTGDVPAFEYAATDSVAVEAYTLASALAADPLLGPLVEQIELRDGTYTLVPKLGAAEFVLGDLSDLDGKLTRLRGFLRTALPEVGWDAYRTLDLRYRGQVVARKTTPGA